MLLPILDLQVKVQKVDAASKIFYYYYRKPMANWQVMPAKSAMPASVKQISLTQYGLCILRNTKLEVPWSEKAKTLSEFSARLRNSGYNQRYRQEVIHSVPGLLVVSWPPGGAISKPPVQRPGAGGTKLWSWGAGRLNLWSARILGLDPAAALTVWSVPQGAEASAGDLDVPIRYNAWPVGTGGRTLYLQRRRWVEEDLVRER